MAEPERELTDQEMRDAARERIGGDPDPALIQSWRSEYERRIAELEAAGVEIPSEAGARVAPK